MCAIVDASVGYEVFIESSQSAAGKFFFDWLMRKNGGTLVAGGKLLCELNRIADFQRVFSERLQAGRARRIPDEVVGTATEAMQSRRICRSNDEHVIALAQISGARLLFTNDNALQDDFRDRQIIGGARGRVYTTGQSRNISATHIRLLRRRDLCDG